jgi:hypothetical protein
MSARRLVASRGTFVRMLALLSGRVRSVYFFTPGLRVQALRHLGVEVITADDAGGQFRERVLSANWACSDAQKSLLLSYPADRLRFSTLAPV